MNQERRAFWSTFFAVLWNRLPLVNTLLEGRIFLSSSFLVITIYYLLSGRNEWKSLSLGFWSENYRKPMHRENEFSLFGGWDFRSFPSSNKHSQENHVWICRYQVKRGAPLQKEAKSITDDRERLSGILIPALPKLLEKVWISRRFLQMFTIFSSSEIEKKWLNSLLYLSISC